MHQRHLKRVGQRLGKYQLRKLIGAGSTGAIYRAYDESLSREVAIKILLNERAENKLYLERFRSEAKAAGQLRDQHVVAVYELGEDRDTHFIAMELVDGGSVADELKKRGAFPVTEATHITADACRGLSAAHQLRLVHRDIKPENLLRTKNQLVKIADFGLSKGDFRKHNQLTMTGEILGTPYFMSPEQCEGAPVDERSDIYSLGATYYMLLTGAYPYSEATTIMQVMHLHCSDKELDPCLVHAKLPDQCSAIVKRATARSPDDRYQTVDDMLVDLEELLADQDRISQNTKKRGETKRKRQVVMVSIIVAVVVAGATLLMLNANRTTGEARHGERSPASRRFSGALSQGVTADTVTFGTTTAYSGTAGDLGRNIVYGIRACFKAVNKQGGIHGRKLELVVLDDGYEPVRALNNIRILFEEKQIFATIGNVGTPTAKAILPYTIENRYLLFAPFSGAKLLRRDPPDRYVFNFRASYTEEIAAMMQYLVELRKIDPQKIAVFVQDDSFGDSGFDAVVQALSEHEIEGKDVLRVKYRRNSVEVEDAVKEIVREIENVDAIVMISTYEPTAKFVRSVKDKSKKEIHFAAVSFVGSRGLAEEFREMGARSRYGEGVIVTQVVPHYDAKAKGVNRYRQLLREHCPEARPSFASLEGFIAAECLVKGLEAVGPNLTTERLVDALENIKDLDLGVGPLLSFGRFRHQASMKIWGTILDDEGNYKSLKLE